MCRNLQKIVQNAWVEPCNPTLSYQLEVQCKFRFSEHSFVFTHTRIQQRLSLGLKPTLVSRMKFEDRAVIAWRRLEYFFKCNILGFPRRTVKKSIEAAEKARLQGEIPEMPHGAFELLRIRNRWAQANSYVRYFVLLRSGSDFLKTIQKEDIATSTSS